MTKTQVPLNQKFYGDYEPDTAADWTLLPGSGSRRLEAGFTLDQDRTVILSFSDQFSDKGRAYDHFKTYRLDGRDHACSWARAITAYPGLQSLCKSFEHTLAAGRHTVQLDFDSSEISEPGRLIVYVHDLPAGGPLPEPGPDQVLAYPAVPEYPDPPPPPSLAACRVGVNAEKRSIGRFGFTKGDGLLDCAMATLGSLNRLYLCGHPDYRRLHRWQYSLLPAGIDPDRQYHGSYAPAQVDWRGDDLDIRYLSVAWRTRFEGPGQSAVKFGCVYSLASAAVLVETDERQLRLSDLEYAGPYTRMLLPLQRGLVIRDLAGKDVAYSRETDGELRENFVLLFGATEFPDVPIQVIFQKRPESIGLRWRNGRLSEAAANTAGEFGAGFVVSPFGIESFRPEETRAPEFCRDAYRRCHFWSRAALAYPVDVEEHYKIDEAARQVEIVQRFQYRILADAWGTVPLKTAPLPPLTDITGDLKGFVRPAGLVDFQFPTKYGRLQGAVNTDTAAYRLPFIPERRKFPLRAAGDESLRRELADGWDAYWAFQETFAGSRANESYYPYPGAFLEKYMIPAWLFTHLEPDAQAQLRARIADNLPRAVDFNHAYDYCKTDWGDLMARYPEADEIKALYTDPKLAKKRFFSWYDRTEPITGMAYKICYLNVCLANLLPDGSRETVASLRQPLIENDWGTGLTLTAVYLGTLLTDGWDTLRRHWETLKGGFDYFRVLQDWCCLSSPYAENGRVWVEGANYGAFPAFARMAEELGDAESLALARYVGAKQGAARLAIFRSSYTYFPRYFRCAPWYVTKVMGDEVNPADAFLHVPDLDRSRFFLGGLYNLSTEGLFPEVFMLLAQHCEDEAAQVMALCRQYLEDKAPEIQPKHWGAMQAACSRLIFLALTGRLSRADLEREIAFADDLGIMLRNWRGIHAPARYLPKNMMSSYLKALADSRDWPVWLESWRNASPVDATFDPEQQVACVELTAVKPGARVEFGAVRRPRQATWNSRPCPLEYREDLRRLILCPDADGRLRLEF